VRGSPSNATCQCSLIGPPPHACPRPFENETTVVHPIVRANTGRLVKVICALVLATSLLPSLPFLETTVSASSVAGGTGRITLLQQNESQEHLPAGPQHNYAQRLKLMAGKTREILLVGLVDSAIIIDTDVATAEVKGDRILITGIMSGTTILITAGKTGRTTYAIDVERPGIVSQAKTDRYSPAKQPESASGSTSLHFTPGLKGGPSLLQNNFEYSQQLRSNRLLRISSETFHFIGGGDRALTLPLGTSFGANRLKLGLDSPTTRLDLLDSELETSPLGFAGYTMRGPHFVAVSNPRSDSTSGSRWRGLELFAGYARPQLKFFNQGEGRLAGTIIPVIQTETLHVRSQIVFISPASTFTGMIGGSTPGVLGNGSVLQTDALYAPDERTNVEGEAAYAKGGLSWRARIDLRRGQLTFNGELSHLDHRSPMIALGAQGAGRTNSAFNLQWQPNTRFNVVTSYNRTTSASAAGIGRIQLNSQIFLVSANFSPTHSAHLGLSFSQQAINAPVSSLIPDFFNLQTRSSAIKYEQFINRHWSNSLEARLILSREENTAASMNRGFSFREQLRYAWTHGSVTGFVNYRGNSPSLESLILRNPLLLPLEFRAAFAADPQGFLMTNRNALPLFLNGVELPTTRNRESGIRAQAALSRLSVAGETVYSVGRFMNSEQHTLNTTLTTNLQLDAANAIQAGISRAFALIGAGGRTGLTLNYVHRFGAGSGGGFQFSKFLGLGRGRIQGHVFMDLNGNGNEDAGEVGLAGMKIQLDASSGSRCVNTDAHGDFNLGTLEPGRFDVSLISDLLGVTLRASNATLQRVSLSSHQTVRLSFALTNSSFAAGRIFNDLLLTGEQSAGEAPGLDGVKLILRRTDPATESSFVATPGNKSPTQPLTTIANGDGQYEFRNLAPGKYILEIDPATLPENFRLPLQFAWPISVQPLRGSYLDLPFAAQRAVSGIVYIDTDGDGRFDPQKDLAVEGARVISGNSVAVSTRQGSYFLRSLPAGKVEIRVSSASGKEGDPVQLELRPEPAVLSGVNLALKK
jgi:hypothetical protein